MIGKTDIDANEGGVANTGTVGGDVITGITFEQHRAALKEDLAELRQNLETAHASERELLSREIAELERKLANAADDYEKTLIELAELKEQLKRFSNTAPTDQLAAAMDAIDNGDRSLADRLLEKIERDGMESAANAAFLRGNIAAAEIRWADAATLYLRAYNLLPTFESIAALCRANRAIGDMEASIRFGKILREKATSEFPKNSKENCISLNELGLAYRLNDENEKAKPLYEECIKITRRMYGEINEDHAMALNNLAVLQLSDGDHKAAEMQFDTILKIQSQTVGTVSEAYAMTLNNLGVLFYKTDRFSVAEKRQREVINIDLKTVGANHPRHAMHLANLAKTVYKIGRKEDALDLIDQAISIDIDKLGDEHVDTVYDTKTRTQMITGEL